MRYSTFVFRSYYFSPEKREIIFQYAFTGTNPAENHKPLLSSNNNNITFEETLILPQNFEYTDYNKKELESALFAAHLMFGISYYKAFCPKEIQIESGELNEEQANFWNEVYTKGLGEFFYKNKIDFRKLIQFPHKKNQKKNQIKDNKDYIQKYSKLLLPLGGGKDSLTSLALLEKPNFEVDFFTLRDNALFRETDEITGKKRLIVDRKIDPKIIELNNTLLNKGSKGNCKVYNGHIPISACISFLSVIVSLLYGYKYTVFSNEKSANIGNTEYLGMKINHQWSKSFDFEKKFGKYIKKYITKKTKMFSLLRPLSEYKIVEIFSRHSKFFSLFSSCNRNFHLSQKKKEEALREKPCKSFQKTEQKNISQNLKSQTKPNKLYTEKKSTPLKKWCGICPKCAFTFSLLSAFLTKEKTTQIFRKNLFADESLLPLFEELLGIKNIKPFECVGEPEEVQVAIWRAWKSGEYEGDVIIKMFEENFLKTKNKNFYSQKIKNKSNLTEWKHPLLEKKFKKKEKKLLEFSKEHLINPHILEKTYKSNLMEDL